MLCCTLNTVQCIVQYSTLHYITVQYSAVQYSTVQYSTVQYSTVQYSTVQHSTVQHSTVQYSTGVSPTLKPIRVFLICPKMRKRLMKKTVLSRSLPNPLCRGKTAH